MGSLAPVLSKAGDLDDFPARYKTLKFIRKNLRAALRVEYSTGGGWGTLGEESPIIHLFAYIWDLRSAQIPAHRLAMPNNLILRSVESGAPSGLLEAPGLEVGGAND